MGDKSLLIISISCQLHIFCSPLTDFRSKNTRLRTIVWTNKIQPRPHVFVPGWLIESYDLTTRPSCYTHTTDTIRATRATNTVKLIKSTNYLLPILMKGPRGLSTLTIAIIEATSIGARVNLIFAMPPGPTLRLRLCNSRMNAEVDFVLGLLE